MASVVLGFTYWARVKALKGTWPSGLLVNGSSFQIFIVIIVLRRYWYL